MAQDGVAHPVERPDVDWIRVADGIFVAGLGVFVFLNATGRLPWTFWFDALVMWPIVLVTGGLRIAFGRTRRAWLVVTGPLIVLGFLAAMASGRLDGSPGPWLPVPRRDLQVPRRSSCPERSPRRASTSPRARSPLRWSSTGAGDRARAAGASSASARATPTRSCW
jgi:hypothetical protein